MQLSEADRVTPSSAAAGMLTAIKSLHTAFYAVQVAAILNVLYCGITRTWNGLLAASIGVVVFEAVILAAGGFACPLARLAKHYGDPRGYVGDIFLPEWLARRTFQIWGSLFTASGRDQAAIFCAAGSNTVSITWMTPLEHSMSAWTI